MAATPPLWRKGFDVVEAALSPRLETVVGSEAFAVTVGLAMNARSAVQRRTERSMRRALHLVNLPAGSDITRILAEIASLERHVRELSKKIDDRPKERTNGRAPSATRTRHASTTRA